MMKSRVLSSVGFIVLFTACAAPATEQSQPQVSATTPPATKTETTTTLKAVRCQAVPETTMRSIAEGLAPDFKNVTFSDAYGVAVDPKRKNEQGWPGVIVAARINGDGFNDRDVATWALTSYESPGALMALNRMAQLVTVWGTAAKAGSQYAELRDDVARYEEADQAVKCARAGKAS